ncbi:IMP cyclohydrolase, partial [Candidatus Woesearchaeota archaeon]|nr:IMP cyclohydrolase [Candidatus Woesearchaeota archaeon]
MKLELRAENARLKHLSDNPNRGLVQGLTAEGNYVQLSWIMGRSAGSRNRLFKKDGAELETEAADESKMENPELIIYRGMTTAEGGVIHIVGNGDQVTTAKEWMDDRNREIPLEEAFIGAMTSRYCEPDAPIFTPRVTGYVDVRSLGKAYFSVIKADLFAKERWHDEVERSGLNWQDFMKEGTTRTEAVEAYNTEIGRLAGLDHRSFPTVRDHFVRPLNEGYGFMITTYMPGRDALPQFEGEPLVVPL